MATPADTLDLARLQLVPGSGRRLELQVSLDPLQFGNDRYPVVPAELPVQLELSQTVGEGYALHLRFTVTLEGPCMRCLGPAAPSFEVDAREVHQPGGDDELTSPYVEEGELALGHWARDALVLALPSQIACSADCRGLCPECGANLNEEPDHAHEKAPDPRWAKLSDLRFE